MAYTVQLKISQYIDVNNTIKKVETSTGFRFSQWDDVNNFLGYLVDGSEDGISVTIEKEDSDEREIDG